MALKNLVLTKMPRHQKKHSLIFYYCHLHFLLLVSSGFSSGGFYRIYLLIYNVSSLTDVCGWQNHNKNVCALMSYAVNKITNIKIVDLKYMETGHSYLEADAVHATVGRFRKHKNIYITSEWALLISSARLNPSLYNALL